MKNPHIFTEYGFDYDYFLDKTPSRKEHFLHMHNYYEFFFFFEGVADYMVDGHTFHLGSNDLIVIQPSTFHSLNLADRCAAYERSVFFFQPQILSEEQLAVLKSMPPIVRLKQGNMICDLFRILRDQEGTFTDEEFLYLEKSTLFNIIACLRHIDLNAVTEDISDDTFNIILQYISENFTKEITAEFLAEKFFVSPSWIYHAFSSKVHMSLKKYVNQKRILYAQTLIARHIPITEVCFLCGYDNYSTFYRQYLSFTGTTPLEDKLTDKTY